MIRRVLLLEDDDALAASISRALEACGHSVTRFATVKQARAAIPPIGFDVLLCDYALPDGTGIDFLRAVAEHTYEGSTILWSGLDRQREVDASGLHVDHLFSKSDTLEVLAVIEAA